MAEEKIKVRSRKKDFESIIKHPSQLLLYLAMFGSSVIFIFILVAFFATTDDKTIYWSKYFSYSTAILLISSYPITRLKYYFENEKYINLIRSMLSTLFFGSLFIFLQVLGWWDMKNNGNLEEIMRQNDFMIVLSAFHLIHVAITLMVTAYFAVYYGKKLANPIYRLVVGTNPYETLKLSLLSQSWIFLHFVWAAIFISFLFTQ